MGCGEYLTITSPLFNFQSYEIQAKLIEYSQSWLCSSHSHQLCSLSAPRHRQAARSLPHCLQRSNHWYSFIVLPTYISPAFLPIYPCCHKEVAFPSKLTASILLISSRVNLHPNAFRFCSACPGLLTPTTGTTPLLRL